MANYRARSFEEVGGIINEIIGRKNRRFIQNTWEELVRKNPVDTYTSSNSWFVSSGAPSTQKPEYGNFYGFSKPSTPGYLLNDKAFEFKFGKFNKYYFITNNQPYMKYLEAGWSEQAPRYWIATIIKRNTILANAGVF